jgi:hypothetical protein
MILPTRNVLISSSMRWRTVLGQTVSKSSCLTLSRRTVFVELSFRSRVLLEPARKVGAEFGFVALGVKRRPAALRGRERDLSPSFLENVVRSSGLFEKRSREQRALRARSPSFVRCYPVAGVTQLPVLPSWSWDVIRELPGLHLFLPRSPRCDHGLIAGLIGKSISPQARLARIRRSSGSGLRGCTWS